MAPQLRNGGIYVFRAGPGGGYSVNVPYPYAEVHALDYGTTLFRRLDARALLISSAAAEANAGPVASSAGLLRAATFEERLFDLANQVLMREQGREQASPPHLLVSSRGYGIRSDAPVPEEDALLALTDGVSASTASPLVRGLLDAVRTSGLSVRQVDGTEGVAGFEINGQKLVQYRQQSPGSEVAALWLSPLARAAYRQPADDVQQVSQFKAMDIPDATGPLAGYLSRHPWAASAPSGPQADERAAVQQLVQSYLQTQDIVL